MRRTNNYKLHAKQLTNKNKNFSNFQKGDKVRVSKTRMPFDKGYKANWSEEIFTIIRVLYSNPPRYTLADADNDEINGSYYYFELKKTY